MRGVGRGMAGAVLKPVSKLGEAISDVGSGLASSVSPDGGASKRRRRRCRVRPPRLLFGALGSVRCWSPLEAELRRVLGEAGTYGVEEVGARLKGSRAYSRGPRAVRPGAGAEAGAQEAAGALRPV